jgi:hypothetical protein
MYGHSTVNSDWNETLNEYELNEYFYDQPLPENNSFSWCLLGPNENSDPDRYVYNIKGERIFFVKREL